MSFSLAMALVQEPSIDVALVREYLLRAPHPHRLEGRLRALGLLDLPELEVERRRQPGSLSRLEDFSSEIRGIPLHGACAKGLSVLCA